MYSRVVSLKPPFFALASGVRIARVMTMSSAFLEVLSGLNGQVSVSVPVLINAWAGSFGKGNSHRSEGAARGQVLENGAESFYSHD